jgi:hypothetical protein
MKVHWAAVLTTVGVASIGTAQAPACVGSSTLAYADTASFFLDAPPGWVLDCNAGKDQGAITVLYRTNESWQTGEAVMYASVLTDRGTRPMPIARRIEAEVTDWRRRVPDANVTADSSFTTKGGAKVFSRRFQSDGRQLFEIVAYVPRGRIMPLLIMTARSQAAFTAAMPAFRLLVQSYAPGPVVKVH